MTRKANDYLVGSHSVRNDYQERSRFSRNDYRAGSRFTLTPSLLLSPTCASRCSHASGRSACQRGATHPLRSLRSLQGRAAGMNHQMATADRIAENEDNAMALQNDTATGQPGAGREVGPSARPWAACLHGGMMRVYLRTLPLVWLATAVAGALTWQATTDRAEDWASLWVSISAGQEGYVPQLSPSGEATE